MCNLAVTDADYSILIDELDTKILLNELDIDIYIEEYCEYEGVGYWIIESTFTVQ